MVNFVTIESFSKMTGLVLVISKEAFVLPEQISCSSVALCMTC